MFEFPAALANRFEDIISLSDALSRFFEELPKTFRYAVEIRSERLLCAEYFRALRNHGIAHVFNSWTDMPSIAEQMAERDAFTTNVMQTPPFFMVSDFENHLRLDRKATSELARLVGMVAIVAIVSVD